MSFAHLWQSYIRVDAAARWAGVRPGSKRGPRDLAAVMSAVTPTLTALSGSSPGPEVTAGQLTVAAIAESRGRAHATGRRASGVLAHKPVTCSGSTPTPGTRRRPRPSGDKCGAFGARPLPRRDPAQSGHSRVLVSSVPIQQPHDRSDPTPPRTPRFRSQTPMSNAERPSGAALRVSASPHRSESRLTGCTPSSPAARPAGRPCITAGSGGSASSAG
jgi:hypothetical protein